MIEATNLTKYYGRKPALQGVSFSVERGEVVGLLGPNGAGKTTIMRILTGFLPPTSGRAVIGGDDVGEHPLAVKARTGYLPEVPPLYPEMRVGEFLHFAAALRLVPRAERPGAVGRAIERCGLGEMAGRPIEHLSKGYRQRLGLAQAIVHEPRVVILDEPTAGLDPQQVREVRKLIAELAETTTLLLSSHILSEVETTCGRVIIINRGRLAAVDSPAALHEKLHAGTEQRVILKLAAPAPAVMSALEGLGAVRHLQIIEQHGPDDAHGTTLRVSCHGPEDRRPELARCAVQAGGRLLSLRGERMSLEQMFIQLTAGEADEADAADM